jgi:hypothetical protein
MGRRSLAAGSGLWITPSSGVHSCWMRMAIDVVALDRNLRVIKTGHAVRPWRLSGLAIGVDRNHGPFRGFLPRKTTPHDLYQATVIAKPL